MRLEIQTTEREQLVDITRQVAQKVAVLSEAAGHGAEGAALVYCPHTTAAVTINENADPDVVSDLLEGLRRVVPRDAGWRHIEGNSDGHIKASLMGAQTTIPVRAGRLMLGRWQGIYLCEFDGPRQRHVEVFLLGGRG